VDYEAAQGKKSGDYPVPRLILVGDFCQLPPVKAPFAFESVEWPLYAANTHTLTEIRRQADAEFIRAIQAARRADVAQVVGYFGPRLVREMDFHFPGTTIFAKNEEVDRFNQLRLDEVDKPLRSFASTRWGVEPGDWRNIPPAIALKEGARVMLLANLRVYGSNQLIYANGDLGTVLHLDPDRGTVVVTLDRTKKDVAVEWVTRRHEVPLESGRRKALTEAGHPERVRDRWEIIGEITYLPVRLAYATTVHKSQGLSLDSVQVNTNGGMFTQPGLLYVALSRARTAEGLRLIGTPEGLARRCTVHPKVRTWL
jgi:ATP-dependent exoDNAse (exonuclease V) alpha subunit